MLTVEYVQWSQWYVDSSKMKLSFPEVNASFELSNIKSLSRLNANFDKHNEKIKQKNFERSIFDLC